MSVREVCLSLLTKGELDGRYANLSLSSHLKDSLSADDMRLLTSLFYTVVERKITYDYYITALAERGISEIDPITLNILRIGMCQLVHMASIPDHAAVNSAVELARNKGERAFVNGILRSAARLNAAGGLPLPKREKNAARYLSVKYSFPLWMAKHFISLLGIDETEELFVYYNDVRYTDLTVNTNKISRAEFCEILKSHGYDCIPNVLSQLSVRIDRSVNPTQLYGFDEGLFFVQDLASALSAEILGTECGDSVIDVCACPGGKSFAAAVLSGGSVLAMDIHESKLPLIESGAARLGLDLVKVRQNDATKCIDELVGQFDRVICDVPCSGLGVLAKKPDIRYKDNKSLQELPELQYSILEQSAKYLKKDGCLLYSTCTLNPDENERVVEKFLSLHDEFQAVDFTVGDKNSVGGMMTLYPHKDGCDGFFLSKIRKK